MCETPLRDGADACLACGTHIFQAPSPRAGEGQVRVALDTARRAQAAESAKGLDVSTSKQLIEAAERSELGGDRPRALDLARAAKRAVEIVRRRAQVEAEIARAEARIQQVREGGIDTVVSGRNLELAREAAGKGAFGEVEKLLARASLKALEVREAKQVRSLIDRAAKQVAHAKERGADTSRAEEALANARKAASVGAFGEAHRHGDAAIETASDAQKYSRAEAFLEKGQANAEAARKAGADLTEARDILSQAREALGKGIYADVQKFASLAGVAIREARRFAAAEVPIRFAERELRKEERRGGDVSRSRDAITASTAALQDRDFAKSRSLAKEAVELVKEAAVLRRLQDGLASLSLDSEDLLKIGADAKEFDLHVKDAKEAIAAGEVAAAKRSVQKARHAAEGAREARYRAVVRTTMETIVAHIGASRVDAIRARELIKEVEDAIAVGQPLDVQRLVADRLEPKDLERIKGLTEEAAQIREKLLDLKRADIDVSAAEAKIAAAGKATDAGQYDHVHKLLVEVNGIVGGLQESLKASAGEMLEDARESVEKARQERAPIPDAVRILRNAEDAFAQNKYYETLEFARIAAARAERALQRHLEEMKKLDEGAEGEVAARLDAITKKIEAAGQGITRIESDFVDVTAARDALANAQRALEKKKPEEAEAYLTAAEDITKSVATGLRNGAERRLDEMRGDLAAAKAEGLDTSALEGPLAGAEEAMNGENYTRVLLIVNEISQAIEGARRSRAAEDQKRRMEHAKKTSERFQKVRKLLADLQRADIDITGAEEEIHAAERAIQRRNFDEADAVLAGVEETANELKAQLTSAAGDLLWRAKARIEQAATLGLEAEEAASIFVNAREYYERGELDDAVEFARVAEQKADAAIRAHDEGLAAADREKREAGRAAIDRIKKLIDDLSRADIELLGSKEAVAKAEAALHDKRYEDVNVELAAVIADAESVSEGLRVAAVDLVTMAALSIETAQADGFPVPRAELVLGNAREAIRDSRFVEAIEYKKVIEDIVIDAKRQRASTEIQSRMRDLRFQIETNETAGLDVREPSTLLRQAEEDLRAGRYDGLQSNIDRIGDSLTRSKKRQVDEGLEAAGKLIEEGGSLGMDVRGVREFYRQAEEAAAAGDGARFDSLLRDIRGQVLDYKQSAVQKKAEDEIDSIESMAEQAEKVGMEIREVRSLLEDAQRSVRKGDYEGLDRKLNDTKSALAQARTRHFADRYEAKLRGIQTMIAGAKRVGANVAEAERILGEAEEALRKSDISLADLLIKQTEISTGIQVQNFIKNRYPNLVLTLPTKGLQANVWNRYVFEIENKGKLAARNVDLQFHGVEVKGLRPIPEIGVDEKKIIEIGVKPEGEGNVPIDVQVFYQRYFDENKYELKDRQPVRVERPGTYLVEDVFLIHADGRLIGHESRKFREDIDEDIFSGMLTVVQEFVKDSFRQRSKVGLKRLDFGDSKILLERSPHTFLATVVIGNEPALLPLYMIEVLKQVEEKFGPVLEKWSGMLHEVTGVEELIRKLIFVTHVGTAEMGGLAESPVTLTARALEAARMTGQDVSEVETLLSQATDNLERDLDAAWAFIKDATAKAEQAHGVARDRMGELLGSARRAVDELKGLGADASQSDLLLRDADSAFEAGNYGRVKEIADNVRNSLDRAKGQVATRKVEVDLASLVSAIREGRGHGADVREAESLLTRIEESIQRKDYRRLDEYLKRAFDSVKGQRSSLTASRAKVDIERITQSVADAKEFGVDLGETERYLTMANDALQAGNMEDLELLVDRAKIELRQRIHGQLQDRYPRLFLGLTAEGLQADTWNRVVLEIANKGNMSAKDLETAIRGGFEVKGLERIPQVEASGRKMLELGLRPKEAGASALDVLVTYRRPLDESRFETIDSKEVHVAPRGTYVVTDALAFHRDGALLAHESREYREGPARAESHDLVMAIREFVSESILKGALSLQRKTFKADNVVLEPGPNTVLVVVVHGMEPANLSLFMVEVMKEIEDAYGSRLAQWTGDAASLEGLTALVRRLLFVTDSIDAALGPLAASRVAQAPRLASMGLLTGESGEDFFVWARALVEKREFGQAVLVVDRLTEALAAPAADIGRQVREAAEAGRAQGGLEISDEQMALYVDIVKRVLEAVTNTKTKAGIDRLWPVKRIAVKPADATAFDAITAFRKIIVGQSQAKELDIVAPGETWRGMRVALQVDRDAVSAAYKLWARKIEVMLKSQDPWKIKAGLAKQEYVVGIDGQRVRIDPNMVKFAESLPESVIEEEFNGGVVYLDTEMTPEILGEGYAKELVTIIKDIRKDMKLGDDAGIETRIRASEDSARLLKSWRDFISRETNSTDVEFVREAITGGYIVEASLGSENFLVSVKASEV